MINAPANSPTGPLTHPDRAQRALRGLLTSHQQAPVQYGYLYIAGVRRQRIRDIAKRLKELGLSNSRLFLNFIEDSTTLSVMLPSADRDAAIIKLRSFGMTVTHDCQPEQVAALDARRFASMPEEQRIIAATKRTREHFRKLALNCPLRSLQRFLCAEVTRMGGTAPSRRERDAAERTRRERADRRREGTAETDAEGWTQVRRRRGTRRGRQGTQRGQPAHTPHPTEQRSGDQREPSPQRSTAEGSQQPDEVYQAESNRPELEPTLFETEDGDGWVNNVIQDIHRDAYGAPSDVESMSEGDDIEEVLSEGEDEIGGGDGASGDIIGEFVPDMAQDNSRSDDGADAPTPKRTRLGTTAPDHLDL
jgi:hypothetical protein